MRIGVDWEVLVSPIAVEDATGSMKLLASELLTVVGLFPELDWLTRNFDGALGDS